MAILDHEYSHDMLNWISKINQLIEIMYLNDIHCYSMNRGLLIDNVQVQNYEHDIVSVR